MKTAVTVLSLWALVTTGLLAGGGWLGWEATRAHWSRDLRHTTAHHAQVMRSVGWLGAHHLGEARRAAQERHLALSADLLAERDDALAQNARAFKTLREALTLSSSELNELKLTHLTNAAVLDEVAALVRKLRDVKTYHEALEADHEELEEELKAVRERFEHTQKTLERVQRLNRGLVAETRQQRRELEDRALALRLVSDKVNALEEEIARLEKNTLTDRDRWVPAN